MVHGHEHTLFPGILISHLVELAVLVQESELNVSAFDIDHLYTGWIKWIGRVHYPDLTLADRYSFPEDVPHEGSYEVHGSAFVLGGVDHVIEHYVI